MSSGRKPARRIAPLAADDQAFRLLFEHHPIRMWIYDRETLAFLAVNQAALAKYGYSRDEFLQMTLRDIRPQEDVPRLLVNITRQRPALQYSGRWRHRLKDGTVIEVEINSHTIQFQGRDAALVMVHDVTEQERVQQALRASEERFRLLAESSLTGIYLIQDQRFRYVNQALASIFGYQVEELVDRLGPLDLTHADDRPRVLENLRRRVEGEVQDVRYEFRGLRKDGSVIYVEVHGRRIEYGGKVGVIGTLVDITDRKRHERLLEAQVMVSQALSEMPWSPLLLERILEAARHAIPAAEKGSLALLEGQERLKVEALSGYEDTRVLGFTYPLTWGYAGRAARQRQPQLIQDVYLDAALRRDADSVPVGEVGALRSAIAVPLQMQERLIGVVSLESSQPQAFGQEDLDLLVSLAAPIALAIENARLFEETRRRANEFSALYENSRLLAEKTALDEVLAAIVKSVQGLLGTSGVGLYLYDPYTKELEVTLATHPTIPIGTRLALGEGLAGKVAQSRRPMRIDDYSTWEGRSLKYEGVRVRATLEAPLIYQDELIGVLVAHEVGDSERKFSESDEHLLSMFAVQAAAVLKNARLYEQMRRHVEETSALLNTSMALSSLDLDQILHTIGEHARSLFAADGCRIFLLEPDGETLRCVLALLENQQAFSHLTIKLGQGVTGAVALSGQAEIVNAMQDDPRAIQVPGTPREEEAIMFAPLKEQQRTLGVISVRRVGRDRPFQPEDLELLKAFAALAASAVSNASLYQETRQRLAELKTLQQVSAALRQAQSAQEMIPIFIQHATRAVEAQAGSIYLLEEGSGDWITQGWVIEGQWMPAPGETIRHRPGEGVTGHVGASGEVYITTDWRTDPIALIPPGEERLVSNLRSGISLPLRTETGLIGVMHIWYSDVHAFTQGEQRLLVAIADMAGSALQRARLYEETRRRAAQQAALNAILIASSQVTADLQALLEIALEHLLQALGLDIGAIWIAADLAGQHQFALRGLPPQVGATMNRVAREQALNLSSVVTIQDSENLDQPYAAAMLQFGIRGALVAPLFVEGKRIGGLSVACPQPRTWSQDEIALVETLGRQLGLLVERTRLLEETHRRLNELDTLHRASQAMLAAGLEPQEIYAAMHQAVRQIMPCEAFVIVLEDPQGGDYHGVYLYDKSGLFSPQRIPRGQGLSGKVIASGATLMIDDLLSYSEVRPVHFGDPEHVRSILAVPLRRGQKVIGMVSAQSYQPRAYTPEQCALLETLAAQFGVSIENARLYSQAQERLREIEARNRVSTGLRLAQSVDEALPILLDETLAALNSDTGAVVLYHAAEGVLRLAVARGWMTQLSDMTIKPGEGIIGAVFLSGEAQFMGEVASHLLALRPRAQQVPPGWSGACIPIRSADETLGVLFVSLPPPRQVTPEMSNLLTSLVEMAGLALQRMRLHEQTLRRLAYLQALQAVDRTIVASLDVRITLSVLLDQTMTQLKVDAAGVLLLESHLNQLKYAAGRGFRGRTYERSLLWLGEGLAGRVALERHLLHVADLTSSGEAFARSGVATSEGFVAYVGVPLIAKGQVKGVLEVFHRSPLYPDEEWLNFLEALAQQAAIAIDNAQLFENLQCSNLELMLAYDATIEGWVRALDLRDEETEGHTQRVTELTLRLAREMGLSEAELVHIRRGALLHDIGKMGISDRILLKPAALSEEEKAIMRRHPQYAYEMLRPIEHLRPALDIPYCHHERWDGTGYPRGLKGEQIPLAARIFAVADVFDALTSDRPYRPAWPREAALKHIRQQAGKHFDPRVVEVFLRMLEEEK